MKLSDLKRRKKNVRIRMAPISENGKSQRKVLNALELKLNDIVLLLSRILWIMLDRWKLGITFREVLNSRQWS